MPAAADGGQNSCTGQDCHLPEGNHTTPVRVLILLFIFRKYSYFVLHKVYSVAIRKFCSINFTSVSDRSHWVHEDAVVILIVKGF